MAHAPGATGRSCFWLLSVSLGVLLLLAGTSAMGQQEARSSESQSQDSDSSPSERTEERSLEPVSIDEGELGLEPEKVPFGTESPYSDVEEINIVGQAQSLVSQEEATSGVGFNEQDLLMEGIEDIRDLSNYTPNLEIKTAFASVNPTLFIRGVGLDDFNANSSSAVSVYQDGIYMNSPAGQLFGLFDIQTVEVLRGPQPTLTNASAGAILVRSRQPTENFEAHLTSTFGSYGTTDFQGALNLPIVENRVAARIAFQVRNRNGNAYNSCPDRVLLGQATPGSQRDKNRVMGECRYASGIAGYPPGPNYFWDGNMVNNADNWAARALISAKMPLPNGQEVDWLLNINGGQNKSLASQYQHIGLSKKLIGNQILKGETGADFKYSISARGGPSPDSLGYPDDRNLSPAYTDNFAGEWDRIGTELLDVLGGSLTGTWQPSDALTIQSVSGYFWHDRATYSNDDAGPRNWQNNDYTDRGWQTSQELSAELLWGDANEVSVGGIYLLEELTANNVFRNDVDLNQARFKQDYSQRTSQWGVYATAHVQILEPLSLDVNYRYNKSTKAMENTTLWIAGRVTEGQKVSNYGSATGSFEGSTGQIALTYDFTADKSVYVKYSRGWKPGHFNANTLLSSQAVSPVKPETINSYEAGLRTQWFDGLLSANVTWFKYEYENLQVFQVTTDPSNFILRRLINSEEALIWGFEWELSAEPIEGLFLGLNGGYLNSRYTNFESKFDRYEWVPGMGPRLIQVTADYSGNRLIASPPWALTGTASYTIPISKVGTVTPRFTFAYRGVTFFDPNEGCGVEGNIPECLFKEDPFWILNATVTWTSQSGMLEVTGFVRNFLDTEYKVQSFDISASGIGLNIYGTPRMAGAIITLRY